MPRRYLALIVVVLLAGGVGLLLYAPWSADSPSGAAAYPEPPASVDVADRSIVTGRRGGQAVAIVDLMEAAPVLAPLSEEDIDRLVRDLVARKAAAWFADARFASASTMTVDVVTIAEHDEYQRPDPNSALAHGRLTIANDGGKPGAIEGELDFSSLREKKEAFAALAPRVPQEGGEGGKAHVAPIPEVTPEQMAAAQEQVLFDELDIWHHPRSLSNTYPSFEPLRVRVEGAQYFFRNDFRSEPFAASGHRYGEIRLAGPRGSLMYLPQYLDFDGTVGFALRLRKSDPKMRASLRVYVDDEISATVKEGDPGFPVIEDTGWHEVSVPFSAFAFGSAPRRGAEDGGWTDPEQFLAAWDAPSGYVFAVEIGAEGASAGDALFFDRLSVLRTPSGRAGGVLAGRLVPAQPGMVVHLRSRVGAREVEPAADGSFEFALPPDAGIVEVYASDGRRRFAPRTGLYLERGEYLPELSIPAVEESGSDYPIDKAINSSTYVYDAPVGARFAPGHFGVSRKTADGVQFLLEQRANEFGFIDRDRRLQNPDRAYRVVLIGDSYYMGLYNDMRDAVWNQAEARAAMMLDAPVEVISATHHHAPFVNSWSQFTEYALKLKPDLVVISLIHPEVLNFAREEYVRLWLGFDPAHPPSAMFGLDGRGDLRMTPFDPNWRAFARALTEEEKADIATRVDTPQYVRKDIGQAPPFIHENLDVAARALAKFAEEARRRGVELALGYSAFEANMDRMRRNTDLELDTALFRPRMKELAERAGVTFLDLSATIYSGHEAEDNLYIPDDGHWSSYAHYRAGEAVFEALAERIGASGGTR